MKLISITNTSRKHLEQNLTDVLDSGCEMDDVELLTFIKQLAKEEEALAYYWDDDNGEPIRMWRVGFDLEYLAFTLGMTVNNALRLPVAFLLVIGILEFAVRQNPRPVFVLRFIRDRYV